MDTYTTKDGIKIGIVSASQLSADETHANYIRDGIAELREEGADLVIACCHWGIEGDHYPNDYQQKLAHQVIDWGADLLVGIQRKNDLLQSWKFLLWGEQESKRQRYGDL